MLIHNDMLTASILRLQYLCDTIPGLLLAIPEKEFSRKPDPDQWSKKEIIGHLIDSATNNHQRFVRGQFEDAPSIMYHQDYWNSYSRYQDMDAAHVIGFWAMYNRHLVELVKRIPDDLLLRNCVTEGTVSLQWLFEDYVRHLEHHLHQVISY